MAVETTHKPSSPDETANAAAPEGKPKKKRRGFIRRTVRFFFWCVVLLVLAVAIARPFLPGVIRWYVNRTLDQSQLYRGRIGDIELHLWKGAYAIDDVRLSKIAGDVPVPLFASKRVEFAIEWHALADRKIVGRMRMEQPELNFVDAPDASEAQTGEGGPWLQIIRDLFPFKINRAEVADGSVHFRAYQKTQPVDVYMSHLDATVDNLSNIRDEINPLVTTVTAKAMVMDSGKFEFQMKLDPFSYNPSFHLATRILRLDVTTLNYLAVAYGGFNFKQGYFDLVVEATAKEGQFEGYVKPLFRDLQVFRLRQDIQEDDPLQFFWQAIMGGVTTILKNQPRNQLGTLVPFSGTVDTPQPAIFPTVINLLRNAFIRAYLPRLQSGEIGVEGMEFQPARFDNEPISTGDGT